MILILQKDLQKAFDEAVLNGAIPIEQPYNISDSSNKTSLKIAKIKSPFGDLIHTLVEFSTYWDNFLPGYKLIKEGTTMDRIGVTHIDHIALAYPKGQVEEAQDFIYNHDVLSCFCWIGFRPFSYKDDEDGEGLTVFGMYGGLKTLVASINNERYSLKFVFVEPIDFDGDKERKGQVQEVGIFT
jgi:hypothetical protein